jgi:hypothetical protein
LRFLRIIDTLGRALERLGEGQRTLIVGPSTRTTVAPWSPAHRTEPQLPPDQG